jgi:hypothetical protein
VTTRDGDLPEISAVARELDWSVAAEFVRGQLRSGLTLAQVLETRDWSTATFRAYLPAAVSHSSAHAFDHALGLSSQPAPIPGGHTRLQAVVSTRDETLRHLAASLRGGGTIGLVEDHVALASDVLRYGDGDQRWVRHRDEVYYVLDAERMAMQAVASSFLRGWSWMGIAVITTDSALPGVGEELGEHGIRELSANATEVIVRAYDGEADVIATLDRRVA